MANATMVDMEMDDEDKLDSVMPIATDTPDYPWGLRITLTDKEFDKLGLDPSEAEIGGMLTGRFIGKVTSMSANASEGGDPCCRCEIQITALCIDCGDDSDDAY